jgi:hypothetical protein
MSAPQRPPYRAMEPRPPNELERLAAEGQRRHDALVRASVQGQGVDREGAYNMAVALGGHYGTPLLRAVAIVHYVAIVALALCIGAAVTGLIEARIASSLAGPSAALSFALIFVRVFTPPRATLGQCAAEEQWTLSLPFRLEGYFPALRATPKVFCTFTVAIVWAPVPGYPPPDPNTLLGVVRLSDPRADGFTLTPGGVSWRSGRVIGSTNISVNRVPVYRNHRVVPFVHELVMQTLAPIHRNCPIAAVTLTRH